jgi:hypothetical protein
MCLQIGVSLLSHESEKLRIWMSFRLGEGGSVNKVNMGLWLLCVENLHAEERDKKPDWKTK